MDSIKPVTTTLESSLNLSSKGYCLGIALGLLIVFMFGRMQFFNISEYYVLYAGARLVGTPYLYDKAHNRQEEINAAGVFGGDELIYSRPPYVAALMAPLGKLPYRASLWTYQALSFGALLGFILLWPNSSRWMTALACAWSLPMALVFAFVRDGSFLLLLLALAFRFHRKRPLLTGIVLSLLGIKFHLFLLLPLLFIGQRRWKSAAGFAVGCATLIGISFAVAGLDWPVRMADVIKTSTIDKQYLLPNIRGILQSVTNSFIPEAILGIIVTVVVFKLIRRSTFEYGMCAVIAGSFLVSHHAGIYDCVLFIPVLLMLGGNGEVRTTTWCIVLFSPVPYVLLTFGGTPALLAKCSIVSLLVLVYLHLTPSRAWLRGSLAEMQPS